MSDRQLARAATSGRSLTISFHTGDPLYGYLVGSDDFHWLVAHIDDHRDHQVTLVHKGSAPRIAISPLPTLDDEDVTFRSFVSQIGQGFWNFCNSTYLGKSAEATHPRQEQLT